MSTGADLGATLEPSARDWLNRLAIDVACNGVLQGRVAYLAQGRFPGADRSSDGVVVRWATRVVPFRQVRRVYDWDIRSVMSRGGGRLMSVLHGLHPAEPAVEGGPRRATIAADLAHRMPAPTLEPMALDEPQPVDMDAFSAAIKAGGAPPPPLDAPPLSRPTISRPTISLALQGPLFQRLRRGIDVPPAPLRRNLETEPRLHGPGGVVRWNDASLISPDELAGIGQEIADRIYTLLLGIAEGRITVDLTNPQLDTFAPELLAPEPVAS